MLNLQIRNLLVQDIDNTNSLQTDLFIKEFLLLTGHSLEMLEKQIRQGMLTEEHVGIVRLHGERSLLIHADPRRKCNPHFFSYDNATGDVSETMEYVYFSDFGDHGNMALFEMRMSTLCELDMSQLLQPGAMEKINKLLDVLGEEK